MSIILKEESANSIPTPPSGKSTLFVDNNGVMSVKDSAGNTSFFPTVGTSNTQVLFTDGTAIGGDNDFTWDKNNNILTIVGNVAAGNVLTDNLLYANGNPWDLQQPGGSNTQIQFNDADQFGGSANFVWDKSSNTLVVSGTSNVTGEFNVSGNALIGGNLTVNGNVTYINVESFEVEDPIISVGGGPNGAPLTSDDGKDRGLLMHYYTSQAVDAFMGWDDSNNEFAFGSNVTVSSEVITFNTLGNARASNFLGNIVGDTANFSANLAAGNADLGNLAIANFVDVASNIRSNNITVNLALSGNTGNFSGNIAANGVLTDNLYYANGNPWDLQQPGGSNTQVQFNDADQFGGSANFVWDKSSNTLTVSGTSNVTGDFNVSGNAAFGNANAGNLLTANFVTGTLTTSSQPNITSVGLLTGLLVGSTANATDFPNAVAIVSQDDTGQSHAENIGLVGEAVADSGNTSTWGIGVLGEARANGATKATGVQGGAYVTNTNDTGAAVGVRGYSTMTHAGGFNVGVLGNAAGSGLGNYAFYIQEGNIASIENDTLWDLVDNSNTAFAFNSTGKANIFAISTEDGSEGVAMSGTLAVTGNASVGGILTDNYYYANGSPVDFQQAGGLNTYVQFNDANGFGGTANFTFDKDTNLLYVNGNISALNANAGNLLTANFVAGTLTTASQPNITTVGTLGSLTVTGNVSGGNLTTGGVVNATGNIDGGNLNTTGVVAATGNVSGGNLTTGGVVNATGNIDGGNLNTAGVLSVTGNANVGNLGTGGLIVATGNIDGGNLNTGGVVAATGNVSGGNLTTAGLIVATGNIDGGNLNTGGVVAATGNVSGGNLTTAGALSVTGNANVGNIGGTEAVFTLLTGTLTTNAQPNVTSVGTLTSLSVTGNVSAGNVSGTLLAGTLETAAQPNVTSVGTLTSLSVTGNVSAGNVSGTLLAGTLETAAQPNITSVGTLTSLTVTGNASAGNINAGNLLTANFVTGTLTTAAQPNITSVGTLTGLNVDGSNITVANGVFAGNGSGLSSIAGANVTGTVANATHSSTANTVVDAAQPNITSVGTLTSLAVTGNISAGNLSTSGALSVTGNANVGNLGATDVTATTLGGTLTTAAQPNVTSVGTLTSLSVTGNAGAGNISTGGILSVTGNANTGNLGTGSVVATGSGSFTGNVSGGNLTTTGILSVTGTGVSSIAGNLDMTSNNIINLADPVGAQDAATKAYVDTLVSSGIHYHEPVRLESPVNLNATYNNGTSGVGATLTNAGANAALVIDGVSVNVADRILVYQQTNQIQNGVYVVTTVGDGSTAWVLTRASDADTYAPSTNSGLDEGSYFFVQEGTTGAGESYVCSTVGTITFGTTNIEFAQFSASQVYSAGTGLTLANLIFSVNASQTQITSVGTLTSLGVSGNITAANITANTGIFTGNGSGLTALNASNISSGTLAQARLANSSLTVNGQTIALGGSGTITANTTQTLTFGSYLTGTSFNGGTAKTIAVDATTTNTGSKVVARDTNGSFAANIITATLSGAATRAGTVTTAAQPNITSVGTLTGLTLAANGDITLSGAGSNVQGANLVSATYLTGTLTTAAQPNITSVGTLTSLSITGNANAGNVGATNFVGSGASLTTLNASNVTSGTLAQARLANASVTLGSTALTLGATVTTVTGLSSVTSTTFVGALTGAATRAGTVTTAAQPNITSVGTLTSLNVSGNANAGNVGATNFVGSGASLTTLNASNVTSGTLAQARLANASVTLGSTALTLGATVTTVTGLSSVTSTTFVGALTGAATRAGTVTTAAQPNITSTGTLTSLTVSGAANIQSTTAATSTTSGALKVAGGIGTNGNSYFSNFSVQSNIAYVSPNGANTINSQMLNGGTLAWSGNAGQLFSITDSMTGNIFSVNDVSGIPMITVSDTGTINLAPTGGFVAFGVSSGVTAAGSTQGTATALTRPVTVVSTVSSGANGVVMPTTTAGMRVLIINTSANALNVYPASGGAINAGATNAGYSLAAGGRLEFIATSTTQWYTLNATYA